MIKFIYLKWQTWGDDTYWKTPKLWGSNLMANVITSDMLYLKSLCLQNMQWFHHYSDSGLISSISVSSWNLAMPFVARLFSSHHVLLYACWPLIIFLFFGWCPSIWGGCSDLITDSYCTSWALSSPHPSLTEIECFSSFQVEVK